MRTTRLCLIDENEGAVCYVEGATKAEAWKSMESKLMFIRINRDLSHCTVRETVESTRRVDGSSFRYNDPANPNNYKANSRTFRIWFEDSGKQDFVLVFKKEQV